MIYVHFLRWVNVLEKVSWRTNTSVLSLSAVAFPFDSQFCLFLFWDPMQDPKWHSIPVPIDFSLGVNIFSVLPFSDVLNKAEEGLSGPFYIVLYCSLLFIFIFILGLWVWGRSQRWTASLSSQVPKGNVLLVLTVLTWLRQGLSGFSLESFSVCPHCLWSSGGSHPAWGGRNSCLVTF